MAIALVAKIKAKAGSEAQVEAAFKEMVEKVRSEPGCLAYVLHKSTTDPTQFVFYESYKDQAAVEAHRGTPHMAELNGKLRGLVDGRPEVTALTEIIRR